MNVCKRRRSYGRTRILNMPVGDEGCKNNRRCPSRHYSRFTVLEHVRPISNLGMHGQGGTNDHRNQPLSAR